MWVIHKSSRLPQLKSVEKTCWIWEEAGIEHRHKDQYETKEEAEEVAALLSKENPVGYSVCHVDEVEPLEPDKAKRKAKLDEKIKDLEAWWETWPKEGGC